MAYPSYLENAHGLVAENAKALAPRFTASSVSVGAVSNVPAYSPEQIGWMQGQFLHLPLEEQANFIAAMREAGVPQGEVAGQLHRLLAARLPENAMNMMPASIAQLTLQEQAVQSNETGRSSIDPESVGRIVQQAEALAARMAGSKPEEIHAAASRLVGVNADNADIVAKAVQAQIDVGKFVLLSPAPANGAEPPIVTLAAATIDTANSIDPQAQARGVAAANQETLARDAWLRKHLISTAGTPVPALPPNMDEGLAGLVAGLTLPKLAVQDLTPLAAADTNKVALVATTIDPNRQRDGGLA